MCCYKNYCFKKKKKTFVERTFKLFSPILFNYRFRIIALLNTIPIFFFFSRTMRIRRNYSIHFDHNERFPSFFLSLHIPERIKNAIT